MFYVIGKPALERLFLPLHTKTKRFHPLPLQKRMVSCEVQVWSVLSLLCYAGGVTFASLSAAGVGVDARFRQLPLGYLNGTAVEEASPSLWPRPEFLWVLVVTFVLGGAWLAALLGSEARLHTRLQAAAPWFAFGYAGLAAYTACAFVAGVAGLATDVASVGAILVGAVGVYARLGAWQCVARPGEEAVRALVDVAASASVATAAFALGVTAIVLVRNATDALSYTVLALIPTLGVTMASITLALVARDPATPAVALACCAINIGSVEVVVVACLVNAILVGYAALRRSNLCFPH